MGGETEAIAKMAEKLSSEIFDWFRWERIKLPNQNFDCVNQLAHAPRKKTQHTHPVDTVFSYHDPYLNKRIYINTDLKSYAVGSIEASTILPALKSLACTIDCARFSEEWQGRYLKDSNEPYEIRGMLFVYNHDGAYDKSFYKTLLAPVKKSKEREPSPINLDNLPLASGQSLHIFEPELISYLSTMRADINRLHMEGSFPEKDYEFFYPELRLFKTSGEKIKRPATLEMLSAPYLIIKHGEVMKYDEASKKIEKKYNEGYIVYYHKNGSSAEEFVYLLDTLSGYQILDEGNKIRIRIVNGAKGVDPISNFERAKVLYASEWNFDKYRIQRLNEIELEAVELVKHSFDTTIIAWER